MKRQLVGAAWFALLLLAVCISQSRAQDAAGPASIDAIQSPLCTPRDDEVWLISTRHLAYQCGTDPTQYELDVRRHDQAAGWQDATLDEFLSGAPIPTVVYVHGNRVNWSESFQHGWEVYESVAACCPTPSKFRFVIWTWCSDQIRGPLRDIRVKADRADSGTFLLGGFLSRLDPMTPVTLIGYSYGARIVTGGLHLLAGGDLGGTALSQPATPGRIPAQVVLLAAALDHDLLCPGECHGRALEQVDRLLVLYNTCDPALRRYDLIDRCSHTMALGYVGLPDECAVAFRTNVEQLNVASYIGGTHDEEAYYCSSTVRHEICRALFDPLPSEKSDR